MIYLQDRKSGEFLKLKATSKAPSFNNVRGRTWDGWGVDVNRKPAFCYLDTTWGRNVYVAIPRANIDEPKGVGKALFMNGAWYYFFIVSLGDYEDAGLEAFKSADLEHVPTCLYKTREPRYFNKEMREAAVKAEPETLVEKALRLEDEARLAIKAAAAAAVEAAKAKGFVRGELYREKAIKGYYGHFTTLFDNEVIKLREGEGKK